MDYEKAYKEALEKATIYHKQGNEDMKLMMETCFHELVESVDERIRKAIIKHFRQGTDYTSFYGFSKKQVIAWLEKQGENGVVLRDTFGYEE